VPESLDPHDRSCAWIIPWFKSQMADNCRESERVAAVGTLPADQLPLSVLAVPSPLVSFAPEIQISHP